MAGGADFLPSEEAPPAATPTPSEQPTPTPSQGLKPGDPAPLTIKVRELLADDPPQEKPAAPVIIVFIKKLDSYSSTLLEELRAWEVRQPELLTKADVLVIHTRNHITEPYDRTTWPERWKLHKDVDDSFYLGYHIIATPSVAVLGKDNRLLGFHPGYNPGLLQSIQQDLVMELHGREALRTAAPPSNPELQMGRRLAERGLWERALPYYRSASEKALLSPTDQLEMARILVELRQPEEALRILAELKDVPGSEELRERALKLDAEVTQQHAPDVQG
jgi:hypothetical protein